MSDETLEIKTSYSAELKDEKQHRHYLIEKHYHLLGSEFMRFLEGENQYVLVRLVGNDLDGVHPGEMIRKDALIVSKDRYAKLKAENERLRAAVEKLIDWMENAPFDYRNGVTYQGCDEGDILGWNGHCKIVKTAKDALKGGE